MPKPTAPKYRTTNWSEYDAALRRRGSLEIWFDPEMIWLSAASGRLGRPQHFSDSAIELCLTLKALFGLTLRQVTELVTSLLKLAGLDWPVPDYTTLCRREEMLKVALGGRPSSGGLHLLIDSTGIKMMGEGEWKRREHGASYRRRWRKVHLAIDAETLDIRAIELTSNAIGDAPIFPPQPFHRPFGSPEPWAAPPALLTQIPPDERVATVGADGCLRCEEVPRLDRRTSCRRGDSGSPEWAAMERGRSRRRGSQRNPPCDQTAGPDDLEEMEPISSPQPRPAETHMHCFKLLGQRVASHPLDRQITELKDRAAILNRFSQIGSPTTIRVA